MKSALVNVFSRVQRWPSPCGSATRFGSRHITAPGDFPYPIYSSGRKPQSENGCRLNYQSIGSGGGISNHRQDRRFGASDAPLDSEKLEKGGLVQSRWSWRRCAVYNLEGIKPGGVRLTGAVIADIYLARSQVERRGDRGAQQRLKLPGQDITVVARSDVRAHIYFYALPVQVSSEWKEKAGNNTSVKCRRVTGKGNEGVAAYVQACRFDRYVEYAYALQNKMSYALLQTRKAISSAPTISLSARQPPTRTGQSARLQPDADRSAGQGQLADYRRDLHPDAQEPGEPRTP